MWSEPLVVGGQPGRLDAFFLTLTDASDVAGSRARQTSPNGYWRNSAAFDLNAWQTEAVGRDARYLFVA